MSLIIPGGAWAISAVTLTVTVGRTKGEEGSVLMTCVGTRVRMCLVAVCVECGRAIKCLSGSLSLSLSICPAPHNRVFDRRVKRGLCAAARSDTTVVL